VGKDGGRDTGLCGRARRGEGHSPPRHGGRGICVQHGAMRGRAPPPPRAAAGWKPPDLQLQVRFPLPLWIYCYSYNYRTPPEMINRTYLALETSVALWMAGGDLRPTAGGRSLVASPDESEEKGLQ
jgi:hypothetical protein